MIILTAAEAEAVRGTDSPGHALAPRPLKDGVTFALPEAVLSDPAHAGHHDVLAALPTRDVAADEWLPDPYTAG
jgi:hypothetical protein